MPILAVPSNSPLDVLNNRSGYELFSQRVEKETIKNLSRLNLRTNDRITIFMVLLNRLWRRFKASLLAHPAHRTMQ